MPTRGRFGLALILMATASGTLAGDGPSNGLVATTSPYGVAETTDRAEAALAERGLGVFARIDHAAGATKAGLELPPTELLECIAAELGHPDPDQVIAFGAGLMEDLRTKGVLLYYRDLTSHVATFDQVVDAFMKGDFSHDVPTPLPWMMPRLGSGVTFAIRDLEQTWEGWRGALFEAIGEDTEKPRLEWAADHIIAEHAVLGDATATLTQALRDWTASEYRKVVQGALGPAVVVVLIAAALLIVLHARVLAPLRRTIAGFQRVADSDFGYRTPIEGSTEIRDLSSSFNRLSVRLDLLHQLIRPLQQGSDLDELVGFLSREFRDLLGFDWIGVVFIDDARANARVETGWLDGSPQPSDRRLYRLQGTLLESALADAVPMHVADAVAQVREHPAYEFLGHLVARGLRDAIFLPLTAQTQTPVPAVVAFATRRPEGFDTARRRLLGNIAQLLTQAFGRTARFAEQGRLAAIGEFASGIAHELRTPLTTVSMALESLAGLARLTKPFFSTKTNGTGLGLAIVGRLVEQHGGEMRIGSDQATGTEVRLSFPALTPD